ncbi:MAG: hypothetical protein HC877_18870 [Thioploca sp.]|nr:hypothetical protein [Thioploca sp.]
MKQYETKIATKKMHKMKVNIINELLKIFNATDDYLLEESLHKMPLEGLNLLMNYVNKLNNV